MLADAWGRSMTKRKSSIPKRRVTSRSRASSCQGGCRGFDPRFRGVFLLTVAVGCSDYQQRLTATNSLWSVPAVTDRGDVSDCRLISRVDSNDSLRGCGLTVQPTVEECLRYQVTFAGETRY